MDVKLAVMMMVSIVGVALVLVTLESMGTVAGDWGTITSGVVPVLGFLGILALVIFAVVKD